MAQLRLTQREQLERSAPEVSLPLPLSLDDRPLTAISTDSTTTCSLLDACFDYSRCSITRSFSVFVYSAPLLDDVFNSDDLRDYTVTNQSQACISVKTWTDVDDESFQLMSNTVIVANKASIVPEAIRRRAVIAAEDFQGVPFRPAFDALLPPVHSDTDQLLRDNIWTIQPPLVPVVRPVSLSLALFFVMMTLIAQILASMHYMPSVDKDNVQCRKLIDSFVSSLNTLNTTNKDLLHLPALDCHNKVRKHAPNIY